MRIGNAPRNLSDLAPKVLNAVLFFALVMAAGCGESRREIMVAVADSIATELLTSPPPVAGLAIAVNQDGQLLHDRAYGLSDPSTGEPLEASQPQRIASLTKQFTAAAILMLVDEGRIELDAPVQNYLPGFSTQGHVVTVRHLMSHTSGLHSYSDLYARTGRQPVPRDAVLDTLQRHPFDFPPGDAYRYSNSNYYLLGLILEQVTGETYARYLEASLLEPLGLEDTGYCGHDGEVVAPGYRAVADDLEAVVLDEAHGYLGGSGGLCSTAADLVEWQHALASGRVINPETYALMTTPTVLVTGDTVPHGFGADIETLENRAVIAQGGSLAGFNSRMAYYPEERLAVAVLVNTNTTKAETIQNAVARAALGMARLVPRDLPLSAEQRTPYVGSYDLGPIEVRVFEDGGRLMLQPSGQTAARLLYQGADVFLADVSDGVRVEFTVQEGRATQLALHQGSRPLVGRRTEG